MVHQQVDVARSQCPMGRAAELASHLVHSHGLAFADRMNRDIVAGVRPKWRLTSPHSTTEDHH